MDVISRAAECSLWRTHAAHRPIASPTLILADCGILSGMRSSGIVLQWTQRCQHGSTHRRTQPPGQHTTSDHKNCSRVFEDAYFARWRDLCGNISLQWCLHLIQPEEPGPPKSRTRVRPCMTEALHSSVGGPLLAAPRSPSRPSPAQQRRPVATTPPLQSVESLQSVQHSNRSKACNPDLIT